MFVCTYMHMYNPVCIRACVFMYFCLNDVCVSAVCMRMVEYCKMKPIPVTVEYRFVFLWSTQYSPIYIYSLSHMSILSFSESCIGELLRMILLIQLCMCSQGQELF